MTWMTYYHHAHKNTHTHTHTNLNHLPLLALPLFPGVCETAESFGELPESFWLFETGRRGGGCAFVCYHRDVSVCVCVSAHVLRGHAGAAGWSLQSQKKRERGRKKKGERPPLAVPVGWFELGTPAGIQACTSCWGGGGEGRFVSVEELRKVERKRGEGGVEGMLAGSCPSVCGDSPHNEVQMHLKKKKTLPPALFLSDLAEGFFFCLERVRV